MLKRLKRLHNRGDTIVEVMIVLAVLGLAIGISYATANRSLLNARQAQENSQAAGFVQSQVEALRTLSANTDPSDTAHYIYQSGPFCIDTSTNPYQVVPTTNQACHPGSVPYAVAITYAAPTFTVKATWPDVIVPDQNPDTVTLSYKLYAPSVAQLPNGGGGGGGGGGGSGNCTPPQIGTPPNCHNPPPFGAKLSNISCVKTSSTQGNYSADISFTGTPNDSISLFVANGFKRYNKDNASFTIGPDGTLSGSINGVYDPGSQWSAFITDNTQRTQQTQIPLCK